VSGASPGETEERIDLGPLALVIRRPTSAERLIDERRFDDDEFLPYWAELWPAGIALARYVAALELGGRSVLELGCGLGLPSLAAADRATRVVATDWAPEAVELVAANAARNRLSVTTAVLRWNAGGDDLGTFDLVLAADVLYEERNAGPLLRLLERVVAAAGEALIADPGRRHAAAFFDRAREEGWSTEEIAVAGLPRGRIVRLRRP